MFQKSIEAIIASGTRELERLSKDAADKAAEAKAVVSRCQSEIQSFVTLGKQVPDKVFDRYSTVFVSTIEVYENVAQYYEIGMGSSRASLRGLMGNESVKAGKYRVLVLLEPLS